MAIETTRDLCLSVADAIREKKGTSELINPQDFAKEIASIEGGGNGGESGSNMEYWDITANPDAIYQFAPFSTLLKFVNIDRGIKEISSIYGLSYSDIAPIGVAIDMNAKLVSGGSTLTVSEIFKVLEFPSLDSMGWKHITESQFYDLNV